MNLLESQAKVPVAVESTLFHLQGPRQLEWSATSVKSMTKCLYYIVLKMVPGFFLDY